LFSATCLALISVKVPMGSSPEFSAKAKGTDSRASANPRKAYCSIVLIWKSQKRVIIDIETSY
jgi:hypothetical protein